MRLDAYLAQKYPDVSRHYLKELILSGKILINGQVVKPSSPLKDSDQLDVTIPDKPESRLTAENIDLPIIWEDDDLIVVDKPSGMVVHPAAGHRSGTLVNALLGHLGDNFRSVGDRARPGLVHRLDKDTSGLLVVAKNEKTRLALVRAFKGRTVHKEYLALVSGSMPEPAGEINRPLGRDPGNRLKVAVRDDGQSALTRFYTEKVYPRHTLLRLIPESGRTHQLRVHLASLGFPIVGDTLYGGEPAARLFLHATDLSFRLKGEERAFHSPLPEDLTKILATLG